jgi:4-hydroxy-4-methyl-2-oxoglutarate aldolase
MLKKIIELIRRNRISTTEVADCLEKQGALENVAPINRGHYRVGEVRWVYAYGGSNWSMHEGIQSVQEGEIVLIDVLDTEDKAVIGDLVAKYLLLYRQAAGIVVCGLVRDVPRLIKENWAIWSEGITPIGLRNELPDSAPPMSLIEQRRALYSGAIAVCDDCGVVMIPKDRQTEDLYGRLQAIEEQEDVWYQSIDKWKFSTFETVCLKKYRERS